VNVSDASVVENVSSLTKGGAKFGLSRNMVSEFWYEGADDVCVHSFVLRPSDFDENKKYPWVLMVHGGPVASWDDAWSTRVSTSFLLGVCLRVLTWTKWNMASWAEQGYIVVCPNITGSVGFGVDFARSMMPSQVQCYSVSCHTLISSKLGINGEWGGRTLQDLVNLIKSLEKLPYLDQDKAVLAGASYGAYMVSWMLGHEIINKACAIPGLFTLVHCLQSSPS
jgi:dipeptidyl aminopeptidase/acylaminoacyl peptidase